MSLRASWGGLHALTCHPPEQRRRTMQDDYDDDAINQGRPPHRFDTRRRRSFEMRRRRTVDEMTRDFKQERICERPPWRPRFNDRKACSSITTEQECGRNRPRCWWHPYVEECHTSYIHDSNIRGVMERPPGELGELTATGDLNASQPRGPMPSRRVRASGRGACR